MLLFNYYLFDALPRDFIFVIEKYNKGNISRPCPRWIPVKVYKSLSFGRLPFLTEFKDINKLFMQVIKLKVGEMMWFVSNQEGCIRKVEQNKAACCPEMSLVAICIKIPKSYFYFVTKNNFFVCGTHFYHHHSHSPSIVKRYVVNQ